MMLLADIIERNARHHPDGVALEYGDRKITFRAYADRARRLAGGLYRLGARHQDRIAVLAMNCPEFIEVYGASEIAGFITATINFRLAPPEIAYVLSDSAPIALVFEEQYADLVDGLRAQLPGIRHYICIGAPPAWASSYDSLIADSAPASLPIRAAAGDCCVLLYTSGTTGRSKGVMRTQFSDSRLAEIMAQQLDLTGASRILIMMPVFHMGGRCQYIAAFWRASTVVMHRKFDPRAVLRAIQERKITHMHIAPTMLQEVIGVPEIREFDLSSMRRCMYAAAPMAAPVLRRAIDIFGPIFINGYGATEGNGTVLHPHQHVVSGDPRQVARLGSVGQAGMDGVLRIVDEDGVDRPAGTPGEILIKSDTVMAGYWNNSAATVESLRDGWLRIGDIGYLDDEGYLFLVDRKKDMIISGGENIYSREVEVALLEHPSVADAAVIAVPDERWGEQVKAIVVAKAGEAVTGAVLIEHCRNLIARYKCPKIVAFAETLPRLPSGKVDKVSLRAGLTEKKPV